MKDNKQLEQASNILKTLIEATDHFTSLIKDKNFNHSFYIFSSIVEGTQAVFQTLEQSDKISNEQSEKVVQYLTMISEALEQQNQTKTLEIVQFSLRPLYVNMNETIQKLLPNMNKQVAIGIYHRQYNPKDILPTERLEATLKEAKKQSTTLYFFTENNINFEEKTIEALTYNNDWINKTISFPDVISNIGVGRPNLTERKLARLIPFTNTSYVGNKFSLPRRLLQHRKYTDLLVPFTMCISEEKVYQFMKNNEHVVFKALGSNRGENIYFVHKRGARYILLDQIKERLLNEKDFNNFIKNIILAEKGSYIIQRYIHTRTKYDEPYHFRSHVQKNHEGKWELVHIYPRIGNKRSNLSNISTEGRVEDFSTFLKEQYGVEKGKQYENEILQLSLDVTIHLDKLYGLSLNELGLDFAIDDKGKIWMHEANNGPQTAYHEEKRAVNYIAYAKYIAENGIMYLNKSNQDRIFKGAFQASNSNLPIIDDNKEYIGILIEDNTSELLINEFVTLSEDNQQFIFTFNEKDVDFDLEFIRGSFYKQNEWVQQIIQYPKVVIDLLKKRNHNEQSMIYEELETTIFTNEWNYNEVARSGLYEHFKNTLDDNFTDFKLISRPLHVFQLFESTDTVVLKPNLLSSKKETLKIELIDKTNYIVTSSKNKSKEYTENELRNLIQFFIDDEQYIVQSYSSQNKNLIEGNIVAVKENVQDWNIIQDYLTNTDDNNLLANIDALLIDLIGNIESLLTDEFDATISEMELDYVLLNNDKLIITEVNPNGPNKVNEKESYAKAILSYANNLLN